MTSSDDGPHTRTLLPEDEQQSSAPRRPRPLRSLLIILGVVTLLIIAIAIANRSGGSPRATEREPGGSDGRTDPTAASGVTPVAGSANGIPDGFPHTEQGAQSAAANFAVALGSTGMFDKARRHQIVDTVFAPETAGPLKARQDQAYTAGLLKRVGLDARGKAPEGLTFVSRTVPVGTKTKKYDTHSATVSVWCTGLIGMAGTGSKNPVRTDWLTHTFELRWTGGDWKTTKDTQEKGPAPIDGDVPASDADEITDAVGQYGGFTYAR